MIRCVDAFDIANEDMYMYVYICTYNFYQLHNTIVN